MLKKITLWALALTCLGITAQAQTELTRIPALDYRFTPPEFTSGNKTLLYNGIRGDNYFYSETIDTITVWNSDLSHLKTFVLPEDSMIYFFEKGTYYIDRDTAFTSKKERMMLCYINFDTYTCGSGLFEISQTLFNNDERFEYMTVADTVRRSFFFYNELTSALLVRSENGDILHTLRANEGCYFNTTNPDLYKLGGKYYLALREFNPSDTSVKVVWFRIDKNTQTVARVETGLPVSVWPSVASRNQQITVSFEEGNKVSEVSVVDVTGRVLKRIPVQPGQREIQISTNGMGSGMHFIHAREPQSQGNCKIIVK